MGKLTKKVKGQIVWPLAEKSLLRQLTVAAKQIQCLTKARLHLELRQGKITPFAIVTPHERTDLPCVRHQELSNDIKYGPTGHQKINIHMRSLLIFGNGLGMALNPAYFALQAGLLRVWNSTEHLSQEHKNLITTAIPGTSPTAPPSAEWQLDKLHGAINATEYLNSFEGNSTAWVTPYAKQVPSAFRTFIHEVAMYFHESGQQLPSSFVDPLATFIRETASHVATLNYDNLLYDSLISRGVLHGYDYLLDGFTPEFSEGNLHRFRQYQQSYYLHLHGSPLYIENRKCTGAARVFLGPAQNNHIVLTHVQHKPYFIESSPILSTYWRHLDIAVTESSHIFLIGYSGDDIHLNQLLRCRPEKKVLIVEWAGAGDLQARFLHWNSKLSHTNYVLYQEQNILNFDDWFLQRPVRQPPYI